MTLLFKRKRQKAIKLKPSLGYMMRLQNNQTDRGHLTHGFKCTFKVIATAELNAHLGFNSIIEVNQRLISLCTKLVEFV